jgi:hypothetical protein
MRSSQEVSAWVSLLTLRPVESFSLEGALNNEKASPLNEPETMPSMGGNPIPFHPAIRMENFLIFHKAASLNPGVQNMSNSNSTKIVSMSY